MQINSADHGSDSNQETVVIERIFAGSEPGGHLWEGVRGEGERERGMAGERGEEGRWEGRLKVSGECGNDEGAKSGEKEKGGRK